MLQLCFSFSRMFIQFVIGCGQAAQLGKSHHGGLCSCSSSMTDTSPVLPSFQGSSTSVFNVPIMFCARRIDCSVLPLLR